MKEVKEFWTEIMRNSEEKAADRLKASELIAKTNGAFLERVEVKNAVPVQIIDDIPKEDGHG